MSTLSEAELARIAKNREKALNLRSAKLILNPYARAASSAEANGTTAPPNKRLDPFIFRKQHQKIQ